ncbi:MAG: UvrD-helicase domain-containing protein [Rickettsiales bacterium]
MVSALNEFIKSEWLMANAGSGKTTALTARVVRLLLLGVPAERIVCITYTKSAASEMRLRVLSRLRNLLLADDAGCRDAIEKLEITTTDAMVAHARGLFAAVLDSPSGGLQLTTIHGFCQSILRRFPLEAKIAPHFTVLEDAAAEDVLRRSKQALLLGHSVDPLLSQALDLIGARGGEHRFETLAGDIIKGRRFWKRLWHLQSPEVLRERIYGLHDVAPEVTHTMLALAFAESLGAADEAVMRSHLPQLLAHKTQSYRLFGEKLAAWLELDVTARIEKLDEALDVFLTQKGTLRARLLNEKEHPIGTPLRDAVERVAEQAVRFAQRSAGLACAEESFALAVLAKTLLMHYEAAKAAAHALDYDDLIDHTLALCSNPETIGWVMTKLDHRIDHLLIDEAQDNSDDLWQLAHILVEELMASTGGMGSAGQPRSLLVVGDEKQSIYSFQGAVPEQFNRYRGKFMALLEGGVAPLHEGALEKSYRSTRKVLEVVDAVCAQEAMTRALSTQGIITKHQLVRADVRDVGQVVLYPPLVQPEREKMEPMVMPVEYQQDVNAAQSRAEQIADVIAHWLFVEKRVLPSKGRALHAGDILILVNRRAPLVQPLIRALQRQKIAVAGIDRLTLSGHLAVSDLLALMQWCGNIADDLALAQVLRSPLVGLSDEGLRALAYGRPGTLWAQVSDAWLAQVLGWRELAPYDFLTQVLEVSGRRKEFAKRFGAEVHEVLDELKAQAAAMPAGRSSTLAEFHNWISGSMRQIKREQQTSEGHEVRIMTVHGAKGLEAPVVILADTVNVPNTGKDRLFSAVSDAGQALPVVSFSTTLCAPVRLEEAKSEKLGKLMAEYYRLLYVALTRARDELHVFGTASAKGVVKEDSWYAVVAAAMRGLGAEECNGMLVLRDATSEIAIDSTAKSSEALVLPQWAEAVITQTEVTVTSFAPSRVEQKVTTPYAGVAARGARERGVRIHRVLELLHAKSDAAVIARLVAHVGPDWSAAEQQTVVEIVVKLHAQERWLWAEPHWAEANVAGVMSHEGIEFPVSGQMDMLVRTADAMVIVDYKTGAQVPVSGADVSLGYLLQLKIYQALVRQIYPGMTVRCAILWTHTAQLMWLDWEVEQAAFPDKNGLLKTTLAA